MELKARVSSHSRWRMAGRAGAVCSFIARKVKGPRVLTASGRIEKHATYCTLTVINHVND